MDMTCLSERDICTKFITPALRRAGWNEQTQIREEVSFTLYAESAEGYQPQPWHNRTWFMVAFGFPDNLDEALHEVRMAMDVRFDLDSGPSEAFFVPLVRSLWTGSGTPSGDPDLAADLDRIARSGVEFLSLSGDDLLAIWVGGTASYETFRSLP